MNFPLLVTNLVNWYKWNDGIRKVNKDYHCHWKWIEFIEDGELNYIPSSRYIYNTFRMNKRGPTRPTNPFDAHVHTWIYNIQLYKNTKIILEKLEHKNKNPHLFFGGQTNFQIPKNY